eukprot:TRINITY_DN37860_c0_g1_i1.p1 TRINITY_DN37860_c0_g1~~TRINITY_DN37860_c0_g1_i1.p1  ORF type:complete len:1304 (-),score=222.60 TRINITY_DN37860_c0_g1_i1:66-3977(-)
MTDDIGDAGMKPPVDTELVRRNSLVSPLLALPRIWSQPGSAPPEEMTRQRRFSNDSDFSGIMERRLSHGSSMRGDSSSSATADADDDASSGEKNQPSRDRCTPLRSPCGCHHDQGLTQLLSADCSAPACLQAPSVFERQRRLSADSSASGSVICQRPSSVDTSASDSLDDSHPFARQRRFSVDSAASGVLNRRNSSACSEAPSVDSIAPGVLHRARCLSADSNFSGTIGIGEGPRIACDSTSSDVLDRGRASAESGNSGRSSQSSTDIDGLSTRGPSLRIEKKGPAAVGAWTKKLQAARHLMKIGRESIHKDTVATVITEDDDEDKEGKEDNWSLGGGSDNEKEGGRGNDEDVTRRGSLRLPILAKSLTTAELEEQLRKRDSEVIRGKVSYARSLISGSSTSSSGSRSMRNSILNLFDKKQRRGNIVEDGQMSFVSEGSSISSDSKLTTLTARTSRKSVLESSFTLTDLDAADEVMEVSPWCSCCEALKPLDILPLRPEDLHVASDKLRKKLEKVEQLAKEVAYDGAKARMFSDYHNLECTSWARSNVLGAAEKSPRSQIKDSPIKLFDQLLDKTRHGEATRQHYETSVEHITLMPSLPKSRFSHEPCVDEQNDFIDTDSDDDRPQKPPVHATLSIYEISRLEIWALNHIKSQRIQICALAHTASPVKINKHKHNLLMGSLCELVQRRSTAGVLLKDDEEEFLAKNIRELPFMKDISEESFKKLLDKLRVRTHVQGASLFDQGQPVEGMHILIQGEVEIRNEDRTQLSLNMMRTAPAAIAVEDIFDCTDPRPLVVKASPLCSRTVTVPIGDEADSMCLTFYIPFAALQEVSDFQREIERQEKIWLLQHLWAPKMRCNSNLLEKYERIFEFRCLGDCFVLVQAGLKPPLDEAKVSLIIEGSVGVHRVARLAPSANGVARSKTSMSCGSSSSFVSAVGNHPAQEAADVFRRGQLIGEEAIYGEVYGFSAVTMTGGVKVISVNAGKYLHYIHGRKEPIQRPIYRPQVTFSSNSGRRPHDDAHSAKDDDSDCSCVQDATWFEERKAGSTDGAKRLFEYYRRQGRIARDKQVLKKTEWKVFNSLSDTLQKRVVPRPPVARPLMLRTGFGTGGVGEDGLGPADLCYPRECDLSPAVQRETLVTIKSGASSRDTSLSKPSVTQSTVSTPGTRGSVMFNSFSRSGFQVHDVDSSSKERVALTGFHVHDADGSSKQGVALTDRVKEPRGDTTLLFSCGAPAKLSSGTASSSTTPSTSATPSSLPSPSSGGFDPVKVETLKKEHPAGFFVGVVPTVPAGRPPRSRPVRHMVVR